MGYRHRHEDLLESAVELALEDGVSTLTYARLAEAVGTHDRTVVYYFPTKHDLITDVVLAVRDHLHELLDEAFGDDPMSADDLLWQAWPVLASTAADPVFGVLFEVVGLAATRQEPYVELAWQLVGGWVDWLIPRIVPSEPRSARAEALAIVGQLHGLLVLRQISGARAANAAARHLGIAG